MTWAEILILRSDAKHRCSKDATARSTRRRWPRSPGRLIIGVEPEAAALCFLILRARVVGGHRRRIDDGARTGYGNEGDIFSRRGLSFGFERPQRRSQLG